MLQKVGIPAVNAATLLMKLPNNVALFIAFFFFTCCVHHLTTMIEVSNDFLIPPKFLSNCNKKTKDQIIIKKLKFLYLNYKFKKAYF